MCIKRSVIFISLFTILSCSNAFAQGLVRFYSLCPDTSIFASTNFTQYADTNIIVAAGNTQSTGITTLNAYVAILDYRLNLLHQKQIYFPGKYTEVAAYGAPGQITNTALIVKLSNNKYMFAGTEDNFNVNLHTGVFRPFFFFFNDQLDSLLAVSYTDSIQGRIPYSITTDKYKNILVSGYITSPGMHFSIYDSQWHYDSSSAWIARYDSNAHLQWEKTLYGDAVGVAYVNKVVLAHDSSSYIIAGLKVDPNQVTFDYFITKIDSGGNVVWQNISPAPEYTTMYTDITPLRHGGYAFINSYPDSFANGGYNRHSFNYGKITENGDTMWHKRYRIGRYGGPGKRILEANNGDLLLYGEADSIIAQPVLLRTDSNGNIKGLRKYVYIDTQNLVGEQVYISYTPNGKILISGALNTTAVDTIPYQQYGSMSMYILTDTFGCLDNGCQLADSVWQHVAAPIVTKAGHLLTLFPNPNNGNFTINTTMSGTLYVYDLAGRAIAHYGVSAGKKDLQLPTGTTPGIYVGMFTADNGARQVVQINHQP